MKTKALKAWLASLPLALLAPMAFWTCTIFLIEDVNPSGLEWLMIILGYSAAIHFIAYLITGLPIFLLQFAKPDSVVWELPGALILGGGLGGAALGAFGTPQLFLIGIPYGLITVIAAYRQRPRHHENAHHLP